MFLTLFYYQPDVYRVLVFINIYINIPFLSCYICSYFIFNAHYTHAAELSYSSILCNTVYLCLPNTSGLGFDKNKWLLKDKHN